MRRGGDQPARLAAAARPERAFGTVSGAIALFVVWAAVAHASGSEWVQALGALAAGMVLIGMLGPRWAVRRVRLTAHESPLDATVGEPFTLTLSASASCRCTPVRPRGAPTILQPGKPVRIEVVPTHRGVLGAIEVKVSSAAPLGLLWWSVPRRVGLPHFVSIAPARGASQPRGFVADEAGEGEGPTALTERGEHRSIREYRTGDSPRRVHWRSTAHTGRLMVREDEVQVDTPVRVVADLADDIEVAEVEASQVMTAVAGLIEHQRSVILETTESGVRTAAPVADRRSAGRRLARAGRNPWGDLAPRETPRPPAGSDAER